MYLIYLAILDSNRILINNLEDKLDLYHDQLIKGMSLNNHFKENRPIQILNLCDLNLENKLKRSIFEGFRSLKTLNLRNSRIKSLNDDIFYELPNLKYINLSDNQIKTLPHSIFSRNPSIEVINLKRNPLVSIDFNMFIHIPKLREIKLSHDLSESLKSMFRKIERLSIGYNVVKYSII